MRKPKPTRSRFHQRKKYRRWLGVLLTLGLLIVASPVYTQKKLDVPDEVSTNAFLGAKELKLVTKESGPHAFVAEFALDDEDQSLLKELANLTYRAEVKTAKGDYQAIQATVKKVSDDYFVVRLEHMPEGYVAMRLTIVPEKIDPKVDMQEPQPLIYYVHEDKVKARINDDDYAQHAVNYKVDEYKRAQKDAQKEIEALEAGMQLNEDLIEKLEDQLPYQIAEDQVTTKSKIGSYQQENESAKTQINDQQERIEKLQEKIDRVTKESL